MKNKFVKWIFVTIFLPLLKEIIVDVVKSLFKYFLDLIKEKMQKWKTKDEENAKTEEEKEIIRKKWADRMDDVERMKNSMDENIDKIVKEAMDKSEKRVDELQNNSLEPKAIGGIKS